MQPPYVRLDVYARMMLHLLERRFHLTLHLSDNMICYYNQLQPILIVVSSYIMLLQPFTTYINCCIILYYETEGVQAIYLCPVGFIPGLTSTSEHRKLFYCGMYQEIFTQYEQQYGVQRR
jgi:hypothetical protein